MDHHGPCASRSHANLKSRLKRLKIPKPEGRKLPLISSRRRSIVITRVVNRKGFKVSPTRLPSYA